MRRRGDPALKSLRDIRRLRVLILHPKDRDCEDLLAQVGRIGCQVDSAWPPPDQIASDVEIIFFLFRQESHIAPLAKAIDRMESRPTLIGIVEFENPTAIEAITSAGTVSVITKPIRGFGLLTSMVIAHNLNATNKSFTARISKLESRLNGIKQIEQAKSILMVSKSITEQQAYEMIRTTAMARRVSMEEVCSALISASGLLGQ